MSSQIDNNKQFLRDLFAGSFRGHAIIMDPLYEPYDYTRGDIAISQNPVKEWVQVHLQRYETMLKWHLEIEDDSVPHVHLVTGTEVFAAAFGASSHIFENDPPCALPLVISSDEADRLTTPKLDVRPLARIFELCELLREQVGPDVPISVPDMQSPFDIAALIWRKEDLFMAMHTNPESVHMLVSKCHTLLHDFLLEFKRRVSNLNMIHCPNMWAPPELGCEVAEDEAGSMSTTMFEEFCLPSLTSLSETFGGVFVHCCATADHQYENFKKIPNLRSLNRVFQEPGPGPAVKAFAGRTVLANAWFSEEMMCEIADLALPESRFLFNMPAQPLEDSKRTFERMRKRCPRS